MRLSNNKSPDPLFSSSNVYYQLLVCDTGLMILYICTGMQDELSKVSAVPHLGCAKIKQLRLDWFKVALFLAFKYILNLLS